MQSYYILTPSQKVELYTVTILFLFIFLIFKPIIFNTVLNGSQIINLTLLFFIWYGLTKIMTNSLIITSDKFNSSSL